jgi:hypothetical protein
MKRKSTIKKSKKRKSCKARVSDKIRINMKEYKQGVYKSRAQAIAVSYSQILKKYPHCKKSLKRVKKSKRKSRRRKY